MREVLNSSLATGREAGTLAPEADLQHVPSGPHGTPLIIRTPLRPSTAFPDPLDEAEPLALTFLP